MNVQVRPDDIVVAAPAVPPRKRRRRLIVGLVLGILALGGAGFAAYNYFFRVCGNCASPIICPDPCSLPHFS